MKTPTWRKQLAALGTAAALLLTAMPICAQAATPSSEQLQAQHEQERDHWRFGGGHGHKSEARKARKLEFMQEAAQYFGIATEGKSAEQLHKELKAAREANPAKWEKFKSEKKAQHMARLQDTAKRLGISTEGKTARQLQDEIRELCKNRMIKQKEEKKSADAKSQS
ncbi:hypothetical protein GZH47_21205 [Paenibacillus rhizovicinus]|uniref:Uncharacterized protein n=1 Tax=Paenibacillus rhizovicinus TaxID=2704463 RepID=A0A6C0P3C7_9BACL|nr:hypothetical protein [Paenibacillus rhizovicinus]QHW33070.1 hypothetical protein GZH47_21205 [Paenibacillus rhizovicinus]